jgi:hypothetical protein
MQQLLHYAEAGVTQANISKITGEIHCERALVIPDGDREI